jgi:hypothetical protein
VDTWRTLLISLPQESEGTQRFRKLKVGQYRTSKNVRSQLRAHVEELEDNRKPDRAIQYRPQGERNVTRPERRWSKSKVTQ